MGIDDKIKSMNPKLKKLYLNILQVFTILMIVYAVATFFVVYMDSNSFIKWFSTEHFMTSVVIIILLSFITKILNGGKIHIPEQKKQTTSFNIPDTYGIRNKGLNLGNRQSQQQPRQHSPQKQNLNIPNYFGQKQEIGKKCPRCGATYFGRCYQCGYYPKS